MGQVFTCGAITVDVQLFDIQNKISSPRVSTRKQALEKTMSRWPLLQCNGSSVTFAKNLQLPETPGLKRLVPRLTIPFGALAESDVDVVGKYRGNETLECVIDGITYSKCKHEIELRYDHTFHWTRTMKGLKNEELCVLASDSSGAGKRVQ
jgi:hypothetical protein